MLESIKATLTNALDLANAHPSEGAYIMQNPTRMGLLVSFTNTQFIRIGE